MPAPELVAHRGWALRYPENTRLALLAAIEAGARYLECDVQLSADGVPFLFHDRTLERLCGVKGPLHAKRTDELELLFASQKGRFGKRFHSEPLARLEHLLELLEQHPEVFCFVELKRVALEHHGIEAVLERVLPLLEDQRERCALISFSVPVLHAARARSEIAVGPVLEDWAELRADSVRSLEAEYVFCGLERLPSEGRLRLPSGRLAVYEVANPELALDLAERGASFVETFAIGEMLEAFKHMGL
jgi:glycerophosphoryl diester phosphodiesterase